VNVRQLVVGGQWGEIDRDGWRDRVGTEALAQAVEVGKFTGREVSVDDRGQLRLACAVVRERKQTHHSAAGMFVAALGQQLLESPHKGATWEQLVAIDQVEKRHRLAPQGMDDVSVIDDMRALAMIGRPAAAQGEQPCRAEKALKPIVVEAHPQAMANEPRRDRVEHLAQREAAAFGHDHDRLFVIGRALLRQRLQCRALDLDQLVPSRIAPADHLINKLPVDVEVGKVARSSQQQLIVKGLLEVSMRALDRAVLVRQASVVARRHHPVMRAQRFVTACQIILRRPINVAERRLQIASGGDIRIVAPDARLSIMEIKWGIVPDMGGTVLWRDFVRGDVLRELAFTGRIFSGEEALTCGFATRVSADPRADAMALAKEIAGRNPDAIRAAKRLFNMTADWDEAAHLLAESEEQAKLIGSPNQIEAVTANMEKRPPRFSGPQS
jgi:Enoyl-CoA hydratase/isomerase